MFLFPYLYNEYLVSTVIASSDQQQRCCNRVLLFSPTSGKLSFLFTFLKGTIEDADFVFDWASVQMEAWQLYQLCCLNPTVSVSSGPKGRS